MVSQVYACYNANRNIRGFLMKVAILGYGGRGRNYANILHHLYRKQVQITAVIDTNTEKLANAQRELKLAPSQCYTDYKDFLAAGKMADWLLICTQDSDHYAHTMAALDAGYDVLLEKPISADPKECDAIAARAEELGKKVAVCHVLRYTPFYSKVKEIIDSGVLGQLVGIEMTENVGYWHQAHSFVRGDWGNSETSTPMIFAKCCHDLDLASYFVNQPCKQVCSTGALHYFKPECAPQGSAKRCVDCKLTDCPYDARKIYLDTLRKIPRCARKYAWPQSRLVSDGMPTLAKVEQALHDGQFGRCVFACDNNVVDYQSTMMTFENGVQCTLTMTAFSHEIYRTIYVRGTMGTLEGNFEKHCLYLRLYGKRARKIRVRTPMSGHGGGDTGLMRGLVQGNLRTDIRLSIQSHKMAYAAEKSRLQGGQPVTIE